MVATQLISVLSTLLAAHIEQPYKVGPELFLTLNVAMGRYAVHLDDVTHFLLYLFSFLPQRSFTGFIFNLLCRIGEIGARLINSSSPCEVQPHARILSNYSILMSSPHSEHNLLYVDGLAV